jgi:putative acetyltransferase
MPKAECSHRRFDGDVRPEQDADKSPIRAVHRAAFGREDEGRLVDALRDADAVIASIVAVSGDRIAGHALFSQVWIDSEHGSPAIASLAPIAVLPRHQRTGIGSALMRHGIAVCADAGYGALIVVGHPAYYPRFGFSANAVAHLESPYAGGGFMGLDLRPCFLASIRGAVRYPAAFADL